MDRIEQLRLRVLVVKCQVGERPAWEELYRRFNPAIGYYLRRLIGEQHAADIQQDVWLTVVRNLARLKSPEAFVVWLYRIARRKAMAPLGAEQKELLLDEQTAREAEAQDNVSAADARRVHASLGKLSPEHRDVLLLRFMEELTYEQIAEVVDCSVGTIRSRIHYAKSALRRQLENDHD